MARTFQVSFKINGAMDGSLQAALQAASNAMRGLGNAARQASAAAQASKSGLAGMAAGLNQLQQAAAKFRELKKALAETQRAMDSAQSSVNSLARKSREDERAVEALRQKLSQLRETQKKNENATATSRGTLNALRQQRAELKAMLKDLGVSGKKIPRELLGTDKGRRAAELLTSLSANKAALEAQRNQFRALGEEAKKLATSIRETQTALKSQEQAARQSGRGFEDAKAKAQALKESLRQQQEALQRLRTSLGSQGFSTSSFAASERQLAAEIDRVNAALRQQQALMQARSQFNASATNLAVAGAGMMGAVYTAEQIAEPFENAAQNAMDYEHAMSKVKALTQMRDIRAGNIAKVNAAMQELDATATRLGATTEFTSKEVADAMGKLGMAGWDDTKIKAAMSSMVDLATIADRHDIQRTADIVSDDMTALGIKAGEKMKLASGKVVDGVGYFSDAFAYATTQANLDQELLHEALKYNAPTGKSADLSLGEIFASNMVAANAGIKGSMSGTAFRAGWVRFLAPPKTAQKSLEQMGMTASDATKQMMEAQAALQEAGTSIDDDLMTKITKAQAYYQTLNKESRAGWLKNLVGQNALSGWQIAFEKGNFDDIVKFAREIDSGAIEGWAADTAKVMRDDTKTAVELLKSSLDALQKSVGDALLPAIRAAAEAFAPMVTAASQFIAQNPAIVQGAAAIAAALATIVVGAAAVKLAFAGWTFITSTVTLVQTALASLGSGAVLSGLISRLTLLRTLLVGTATMSGFATFGGWKTLFVTISTQAAIAAASIKTFFASLTLSSIGSGVVSTLTKIGTAIRGAAMASMSFAFSPVGVALMALALAGLYVYQNWDKVAPVLSQIAGIVTGSLASAFQTVVPAVQNFINILGQLGDSSALQTLASVVGGTLVQAFTALLGIAATAISVVVRGLGDLVKTVADLGSGLVGAFNSFSEGNISEGLSRLSDTASKTFDNIKQAGQHAFDGALNGAKLTGEALDVLNGKVTVAQQNALKQAPSSAPQFDDPMMNAAQVAQPIDTSQTQAALDQVGNSAQNAATNLQGVDQAATGVQTLSTNAQTAATGVQTFGTASQTASTGVQQLSTNATTAGAGVQQLGSNAQAAGGGIMSLSDAASGATGGVSALGSAASGAAGSVSGLGAAVQAACAQLASAGANAAAAVANAAPKANYRGGIYKKGAFLTTFAEKSPEAAIPLDRSQRAIDLWTQTGQILGQLPGKGGVNYEQARKFEDAIKEYNKNPKDLGTLNKTLDTHAQVFGGSRGGQARYVQSRRRAAMRQMPQTLPQPQGEMSDEVRTKVANLDRLIKAADYLPDTESNRRGKADLIRMREEYLRQQGFGGGRMSTVPQPQASTARRSAYVARSRQSQVPMITAPPFNPDRPLTQSRNSSPPLITTPPFAPTNQRGALEGLTGGLGRQMSFGSSSPSITINVTVNGNANADEVQRGIEQALPSIENLARQFDMVKHEAARRSFD